MQILIVLLFLVLAGAAAWIVWRYRKHTQAVAAHEAFVLQELRERAAAAPTINVDDDPAFAPQVPLLDLVITFYQARGYQTAVAQREDSPVQYWLQHKEDPQRIYAVLALASRSPIDAARVGLLVRELNQAGRFRLMFVAESGFEETAMAQYKDAVQMINRPEIERRLDTTDREIRLHIMKKAMRRSEERRGN
jgi:hypothetical protein